MLVGGGFTVGFFVGLGFGLVVGLLVGLGVFVGLGVLVAGAGVSVGGTGVKVAVCTTGVFVAAGEGVQVLVGIGVEVGIGVCVGVRVSVKVGLGVLVGVAVGSERGATRLLDDQTRMPHAHTRMTPSTAIATTTITRRFLLEFIIPPSLPNRWTGMYCAEEHRLLSAMTDGVDRSHRLRRAEQGDYTIV